jgi:predicted ArsR family transcriptional regulator
MFVCVIVGDVTMDPSAPEPASAQQAIRAVAALDDDLRSGMYGFIRRARRPVTRDEAAASVGISRKLAAFHLDKLVEAGVLRAGYQAVGGVRKVGRTPKVYEPVEADILVSIPQRHHDVLAGILVDAVLTEADDEDARASTLRVARTHGEEIGSAEREQARPGRLGAERALTLTSGVLERYGFEPDREIPTRVRLRNCPFHPLACRAPDLVCGINQAFCSGVLAGLDATTVEAVLDPRVGECCVELRAAGKPD